MVYFKENYNCPKFQGVQHFPWRSNCHAIPMETYRTCYFPGVIQTPIESFVIGGPTLTGLFLVVLVYKGRADLYTTIRGPSSARQQKAMYSKWCFAGVQMVAQH